MFPRAASTFLGMGVYQTRWGFLALLFLGCDPADPTTDAGLRGPADGVLMFDPSMLIDASISRDAGVIMRVDAARPQGDAGRRQRCGGIPYSCATRATACNGIMGCFDDSECRGFSSGCYLRSSSYSCVSQSGCYWSSSSRTCSGSARSCSSFGGSASCSGQEGCYWSDRCGGTAFSCAILSNAMCATQPGCSLVWE